MVSRRLLALSMAAALVLPEVAAAHAIIIDSTPGLNATVAGPDLDIQLRFNSRIDRARSSMTLTPAGAKPSALPLDATETPDLLKAHAAGLKPGGYTLRWQVLSVDGHITRGDIPFKVGR